jgi:hypothetical protein
MVIIETSIFTKRIKELLADDVYRELQNTLVAYPESGKLIRGSGGLRKVRWGTTSKGKRGGVRAIYYFSNSKNQIFMLMVYVKNERSDLTKEQLSLLKKVVEREFKNE